MPSAVPSTRDFDEFVIDAYLVVVLVGFVAIEFDVSVAHFECLRDVAAAPDDAPCCARAIYSANGHAVAFRKILLLHYRDDLYRYRLFGREKIN